MSVSLETAQHFVVNSSDYFFAGSLAITQEVMKAPLPDFSPLVLQHIQGKSAVPERIWSLMISEAAHYYLGKWPGINERSHYSAIGSRMYEKYPSIGLNGANPWVYTKHFFVVC